MSAPVSEITFVGMPKDGTKGRPAPSAANMPGWKMISEAIADAINTSGLTVEVIAERTDLTRQYIYSMMKGTCNPGMDKVEAVMQAAGHSLADFIYDRSHYGRDKRLHDQVQDILNQRGENAIALKTAIKGLIALSAENTKSSE